MVIPAPFYHILLFATKDEGGRTDHVKASDWVMSPWLRPSFLLSVSWSFFLLIHFFFKKPKFPQILDAHQFAKESPFQLSCTGIQ